MLLRSLLLWIVNRQRGVLGFGWRIHMVPPVVFAIFSFGFRAGVNARHIDRFLSVEMQSSILHAGKISRPK